MRDLYARLYVLAVEKPLELVRWAIFAVALLGVGLVRLAAVSSYVFIDNGTDGEVGAAHDLALVELPPGPHRLEARTAGVLVDEAHIHRSRRGWLDSQVFVFNVGGRNDYAVLDRASGERRLLPEKRRVFAIPDDVDTEARDPRRVLVHSPAHPNWSCCHDQAFLR